MDSFHQSLQKIQIRNRRVNQEFLDPEVQGVRPLVQLSLINHDNGLSFGVGSVLAFVCRAYCLQLSSAGDVSKS